MSEIIFSSRLELQCFHKSASRTDHTEVPMNTAGARLNMFKEAAVIYVAGHRGKCKHSDFIQGFGAEDSSSCECEVRIFLKSCVVYLDVILIVVS